MNNEALDAWTLERSHQAPRPPNPSQLDYIDHLPVYNPLLWALRGLRCAIHTYFSGADQMNPNQDFWFIYLSRTFCGVGYLTPTKVHTPE